MQLAAELIPLSQRSEEASAPENVHMLETSEPLGSNECHDCELSSGSLSEEISDSDRNRSDFGTRDDNNLTTELSIWNACADIACGASANFACSIRCVCWTHGDQMLPRMLLCLGTAGWLTLLLAWGELSHNPTVVDFTQHCLMPSISLGRSGAAESHSKSHRARERATGKGRGKRLIVFVFASAVQLAL